MNTAAKLVGIGLGAIVIIALLLALGVAIGTFMVALIWNWLGLHAVFGLSALSFGGCVAVGAALSVISNLLYRPTKS